MEIAHVIDAFRGALPGELVVLALERRQLDCLEVMLQQHPRGGARGQALRERVINRPQISSDAFPAYPDAIERAFGTEVDYGQIVKQYVGEPPVDTEHRYSPGAVVGVHKRPVMGRPRRDRVSTSYVERSNLTFRMQQRRFTRLTNGFSKKLENHEAAVSLFVTHYNFCRVHEALRMTPAMVLGVADHIWTIGELVEAALGTVVLAPAPGRPVGPFRVIDGGLS